jgi:hypothetical protein
VDEGAMGGGVVELRPGKSRRRGGRQNLPKVVVSGYDFGIFRTPRGFRKNGGLPDSSPFLFYISGLGFNYFYFPFVGFPVSGLGPYGFFYYLLGSAALPLLFFHFSAPSVNPL